MVGIYSLTGGNSPDEAFYYEIPYLFYDELENLYFIKEMGIEINKI